MGPEPRSTPPRRAAYPKRAFDVAVAVMLLALLAPVMILVALVVRVKLGSPIFFVQTRPGLRGNPFKLVKFRTMLDTRSADGRLLSDAERLTRFGRFLRSTSLDELPELWNVLRGEMSLAGPRPLLMEYLGLYSPRQARRHDVRPGITGWAQVNGRNAVGWSDRFEMDVWYVENVSLRTDLRILWRTVADVLSRRGISAEGEATVRYFSEEVAASEAPPSGCHANGARSGTDA